MGALCPIRTRVPTLHPDKGFAERHIWLVEKKCGDLDIHAT